MAGGDPFCGTDRLAMSLAAWPAARPVSSIPPFRTVSVAATQHRPMTTTTRNARIHGQTGLRAGGMSLLGKGCELSDGHGPEAVYRGAIVFLPISEGPGEIPDPHHYESLGTSRQIRHLRRAFSVGDPGCGSTTSSGLRGASGLHL